RQGYSPISVLINGTIIVVNSPFMLDDKRFMGILAIEVFRRLNKVVALPIRPMNQVFRSSKPVERPFPILPERSEIKHDPSIIDPLNHGVTCNPNRMMHHWIF